MSINKIDVMLDDAPIDVKREANFIWSLANKLRGTYSSDEYRDVIIPMTIIRRFECALEETKDKVVEKFKENPKYPVKGFCQISGYQFYNTSEWTLKKLINDPDYLADNFKSYINGFSSNIKDIIKNLDFDKEIDKMDEHDKLLGIIKAFSELDLNPKTTDNMKMGYIFEELIRKFSENAKAGEHYTGRDIIKLMVSLLLSEGCEDIYEDGKIISILDQAAGTGGMLSVSDNYIKSINPNADILLFAQENNPRSYAMCLAEMLIRGQDANNIKLQDTMKADAFPNKEMRFCIMNPPFGQAWGGKNASDGVEQAVKKEYQKGENSRWPAGLPATNDMQLLFVQSALNKISDDGRIAIIENGSPLSNGKTSSGESQIRRWLLDNDYIEAIIQLNKDMFYNTSISTYIWILSKNKRDERKGKIQLIDASTFSHKLRRSLGKKRYEITPDDRVKVTNLYSNFEENEFCKIFDNNDFVYREYTVMQPLQRSYGITEDRIQSMIQDNSLKSLYDIVQVNKLNNKNKLTDNDKIKLRKYREAKPLYDKIIETLRENISDDVYYNQSSFEPVINNILNNLINDSKLLKDLSGKIIDGLSVMDKTAEIHKDNKGNIIYDKSTKDIELVPYNVPIQDYMEKEVLPYIPDAKAFFDESPGRKKPVIKTGAEIPFTRIFYKYKKLRSSDEILNEIKEDESIGLPNNNIKMKDSGIEYIGMIPEEWEIQKVKYLYSMQTGFTPDTEISEYYDDENGYVWVNINDLTLNKYINDSEYKISKIFVDEKSPKIIPKGSLLYSFKLSLGQVAIAGKDLYSNEAIASFLDNDDVDLNYLYYSSSLIKHNANENIYGAKLLNQTLIKNASITFPPLDEQKRIANFLDDEISDIDDEIIRLEELVEKYKEYKQSLIFEYVTGKKEVPK